MAYCRDERPARLGDAGVPRLQNSKRGSILMTRNGSKREKDQTRNFFNLAASSLGLKMPLGVMKPVISSGGVTSKPGLSA